MSMHHDLIRSLTGDNGEIVLQFFVAFSRFEYALKRAGFVKGDRHNNASADWCRFANERLPTRLADIMDPEFTEASLYLLHEPPGKQIFYEAGRIVRWQANSQRSRECEAEYLLRLVKDVRNNLFHGGKYPDGPVRNQARNKRLLQACLTILEKCLSLDADVKHFFEELG